MKTKIQPLLIALALIAGSHQAAAQGTAFTYQGQLQNNGSPASGTYNLTFSLFNNNSGGSAVAGPVTNSAVNVTNGLFTVLIDFGSSVFTGATKWLQIGVETNGISSFTTLTPRQLLTPTPQSIYALNAGTAALATSAANFSGSVSGDVSGTQGATVVSSVGGQTAAHVASGVIAANGATSSNVPNAIVARNGSGSFSAGSVTLSGTLHLPFPAIIYSGTNTLLIDTGSYYAGLNAGYNDPNNPVGANYIPGFSDLYNVGVGDFALFRNMAGYYNTAIGENALQNNTSGDFNTAIGDLALLENTSGGANTAVGVFALVINTTGVNNTAIGENALYANTTGSDNTASGVSALQNNTTGTNNTAIGENALYANTTGNANTASGVSALQNNTTGSGNTASGSGLVIFPIFGPPQVGALQANTTGDDNTATGASALGANTTGFGNTANGFSALENLRTGYNNIAVGFQAGDNFTLNESGNIDIGNSGNAGENNTIRIGDSTVQTTCYLAGNVGLGALTTAPQQTLSLNGGLNIDQANANNGYFNAGGGGVIGTTGAGLSFGGFSGNGSGEGIASQRTSGANQFDLAFYTDYKARMTILNNGYVGIGTSSPTAPLHVADDVTGGLDNPVALVENTDTTTSTGPALRVLADGSPTYGALTVSTGAEQNSGNPPTTVLIASFGNSENWVSTLDNNGNWLASGSFTGNAFISVSDRNAKENFQDVSAQEVLNKVTALPLTRWNFKQDKETQHIGPMAQDFQAAFQLSADDKHISLVDEGGVALAAIQGLNEKVENGKQKTETQMGQLEAENEKLKEQNDSLADRLNELEALVKQLAAQK